MNKTDIQIISYEEFEIVAYDRVTFLQSNDLSPYLVFLVLKEWFGLPIVEQDEPKIQWHFYLFTPNLALDVHDWKLDSLSIDVYKKDPDFNEVDEEIAKFVKMLKKQTDRQMAKTNSAISKAKSFLYKNPFALYFTNAENLLSNASEWSSIETKTSSKLYQLASSGDLYRAAFFLYVASFEGLLNLIYEIYLNQDLRDERIFTHLKRSQIDVKLRLAPVYCTCFKQQVINANTEEFRRFQFIVDLRNDFVHANITKPMKDLIIEDEGFRFFIDSAQVNKYNLPRDATRLDFSHLEFVRETILDMTQLVLDSMQPRYKREFTAVIYNDRIMVDIEEGELIIA